MGLARKSDAARENREYLMTAVFLILFLLVLPGYFLIQNTIPEVASMLRIPYLVETGCSIRDSHIEKVRAPSRRGSHRIYQAVIKYSYEVEGKILNGSRVNLFETMGLPSTPYEEIVAAYPAGARVSCFYDPRNLSFVVLQKKIGYLGLLLGLMPLGFLYVGVRALWYLWRGWIEEKN